MKVFSVAGYTKSGKTTTIEKLIAELKKRGYSVGSVKDVHYEKFAIDTEGTNTYRHRAAGSELVTARGKYETDILFQEQLNIYKIASFYSTDFLIIEGIRDANVPMVLTADSIKDLDERYDYRVFLVSGKIADQIDEYKGIPAISALQDTEKLADIIEEKTFEMLPDFDPKCCSACGYTCREMCALILQGKQKRSDCVIGTNDIALKINGKDIMMVPFVKKLLRNMITGFVSELDGYEKDSAIEIKINGDSYQFLERKEEGISIPNTNKIDNKLKQAIETIYCEDRASASLLQRRMKIGYSRAARIMDQLSNVGIISYASETGMGKPRKMLVTKEEALQIIKNSDSVDFDTYKGPMMQSAVDSDDFDCMMEQAVGSIYSEGRMSIAGFQRKFRIGYIRASKIMDQLENLGILSAAEKRGSIRDRNVLVTEEEALIIIKNYKNNNQKM